MQCAKWNIASISVSENGEGERGQPLPHLPGPDQRGGTTTPSSVSQRFTFFHAAS